MEGREDHFHSSPSLSNSGMRKLPVSGKGRRKSMHGERKRGRISECTKGGKHMPQVPKMTSFPKPPSQLFRQHNFYTARYKVVVEAVGMRRNHNWVHNMFIVSS